MRLEKLLVRKIAGKTAEVFAHRVFIFNMNIDAEDKFPKSFFCPLTHEIMEDPVMDPEGTR